MAKTQKSNFVANQVSFSQPHKLKPGQSLSSVTSSKHQPSKLTLQKPQQSPKKAADNKRSLKTKAKPRPYTAPAIEVKVALVQNANGLAIATIFF